jgi:aldehyde:ferredoxin oxidoreductase
MCFNAREGMWSTSRDFKLSSAHTTGNPPARPPGPTKDVTLDNHTQIKSYLETMGWNTETGHPTSEALKSLGLSWVEQYMGS